MTRDNRLIAFALFAWGLGEGLFIYIEPLYLRALGADPVAIGSILAAAALAAGLAHVPAGMLADRLGRKPILIAGWSLGLAAAIVMFLARDLRLFVPALIAYTFTGFVIAPINAYVAAARGPQSVQRALTLVSAGFWGGSILSPALGGLIARATELRMVFAAATVAFALSTLAVVCLAPQPRTGPPAGHSRYAALRRNRRFMGFSLLVFFALLAMQVGLPFMPNYVVEVRGFDAGLVGLLGSANSLGTVTFNLVLGARLPRRAFLVAQACLALSLAMLLLTASRNGLVVVYFLRAGWYLARNMAAAQVGRVVAPAETGLAFGLIETVCALAAILGPLLAGLLYARDPALPFQVSLVLVLLSLPLFWRYAPRRDAYTPDPVNPLPQPTP
jgi:predicted MFS family arabinose efflux permease